MRGAILLRNLRDRRRSIIAWTVGLSAFALMYVAMYPSMVENSNFDEITESMPEAMQELFSLDRMAEPAGFLNGELFSLMAPMLVLVYTIGVGTDLVAGEEERHTMDLLMAHPVKRTTVVLEKLFTMLVGLLTISVGLFAVVAGGAAVFGVDLPLNDLAAACTGVLLLGSTFGTLALLLGALTGKRGLSRGITAALAAAFYLLSFLAPLADWLQPYRPLSPVYHATGFEPMLYGWGFDHFAYLVVLTVVFAAGSLFVFERRDLRV